MPVIFASAFTVELPIAVVEPCPVKLTFASASIPVISTEPIIALKAGA